MKREIKFRIWSKPLLKWISDLSLENLGDIEGVLNDIFINNDIVFQQYTGLKDKNNKEIYEGDIVKICWVDYPETNYPEYTSPIYVIKHAKIVWDDRNVMFVAEFLDWFRECSGSNNGKPVRGFIKYDKDEIEIIGNIFENVELLK
jgi:uncharacterized phage protein (TIGR01671 family)